MPETAVEMTDAKLVSLVEEEFENSQGAEGGDIAQERAKALNYYLSEPFGDEEDGQSKVVTSDVAEVVDGLMPSLLRIFTTAENLINFDPVGGENPQEAELDEKRAAQESDYVNYVFFKKNPAFIILFVWFFDALVQKNGIVKAWWDDTSEVTTETYEGLNDPSFLKLLSDPEYEVIERSERETKTIADDGVTLTTAVLHDVKFKRTRKRGQVRIENVPPEEYRVSADARSILPGSGSMVGHEREMPRSDLHKMGFDKELVDSLNAVGTSEQSTEKRDRKDKTDDQLEVERDKSRDKILVKEAYINVDFNGDGISELRQVILGDGKLLSNEEVDRDPFHVITPQPMPHQHFGRAWAEKVMDTQLVNSHLRRQTLDNLYRTNRPGHGVWEQGIGDTTLTDLLTERVGRVARFARPPAESYMPLTVPFTAGATFPYFELLEKEKRDRTGIASDSQGLSPEALKNIQQSVLVQALDMSRMKQEAVVRVFAETGVKSLFLHIREMLHKHLDKRQVVRLRGTWVDVNPTEWREREDTTVGIGLGIGTREQNLLHLEAIWQKQKDMVDGGGLGVTVTLDNLFNTAAEFVKNANMKDPERFFKDPAGAQPVPRQDPQAELLMRQLQVQQSEIQVEREKNFMQHSRDMEKIRISQQEMTDKFTIAMEQIANTLTEFELKYGQDVPGAKV